MFTGSTPLETRGRAPPPHATFASGVVVEPRAVSEERAATQQGREPGEATPGQPSAEPQGAREGRRADDTGRGDLEMRDYPGIVVRGCKAALADNVTSL